MIQNECCANCGCNLGRLKATGISGLYFPGNVDIELCESCFLLEDALIDEVGTNNIPERLSHYLATIKRYG
jgi:hypothetical protein